MKKIIKALASSVALITVFGAAFFSFLGYIYGEDDLDWE